MRRQHRYAGQRRHPQIEIAVLVGPALGHGGQKACCAAPCGPSSGAVERSFENCDHAEAERSKHPNRQEGTSARWLVRL